MDAPKKWRFRFGLKGLLVTVAACGALLAVHCRRTDPMRARAGMSKVAVWWYCGQSNGSSGNGDWLYAFTDSDGTHWCVAVYFQGFRAANAYFGKTSQTPIDGMPPHPLE